MKEALYRVAQEAMNNAVKHANPSGVGLTLTLDTDGTTIVAADDGTGFDPGGDFPCHLGLRSMRERVDRAGAR